MMRTVAILILLLASLMTLRGMSWASERANGSASTLQAEHFPSGQTAVGIPTILPAEHGVFRAYRIEPDVETRLLAHPEMAAVAQVQQDLELRPVAANLHPSGRPAGDVPPLSGDVSGCQSCAGGSSFPYNRCGCNGAVFPWIDGPGRCDQWCVGPKWEVEADGLMIFREDATWDPILASVGSDPSLLTQFDQAPGARIVVTGYNQANFGMQVVYEGVYSWDATAQFPQVDAVRSFEYESSLNSVEINFLQKMPRPWQLFAGFRYVEIQENFSDHTIVDKPVPAPADPPAAPVAYVDSGTEFLLKNRLLGF